MWFGRIHALVQVQNFIFSLPALKCFRSTKHDHVPAARFRLILTSSTASMTALPLLERLQVRESVTITRRNSKTHLLAGWVISTRFSRVTELSPIDSPSFSLSEPSWKNIKNNARNDQRLESIHISNFARLCPYFLSSVSRLPKCHTNTATLSSS